jgi:hypothetical protein
LGKAALQVLVGPRNRFGAHYFQLWLSSTEGASVAGGLIHRGSYPAYNWIEVMSLEPPYEGRLLSLLGGTVPPGGHLMVEYDSDARRETAATLSLGVPSIATPVGELLYRAGCGLSFKDWSVAEGGMEGPRKLQGFRPPDMETATQRAVERCRELREFLSMPPGPGHLRLQQAARRRAQRVLKSLEEQSCRGQVTGKRR